MNSPCLDWSLPIALLLNISLSAVWAVILEFFFPPRFRIVHIMFHGPKQNHLLKMYFYPKAYLKPEDILFKLFYVRNINDPKSYIT